MFLSRLGAVSLSVLGRWVPFSVPLEIYFSPEGFDEWCIIYVI
jgi:hypothetical protein